MEIMPVLQKRAQYGRAATMRRNNDHYRGAGISQVRANASGTDRSVFNRPDFNFITGRRCLTRKIMKPAHAATETSNARQPLTAEAYFESDVPRLEVRMGADVVAHHSQTNLVFIDPRHPQSRDSQR